MALEIMIPIGSGLVFILLSALLSGAEIAFVSANKFKIEVKVHKNNLSAEAALFFMNNPQYFYPSIIIGSVFTKIAFASFTAVILFSIFGFNSFAVIIIIASLLILFGEIIPKYAAKLTSDKIILITSIPLKIIYYIVYPFIKIITSLRSFPKILSSEEKRNSNQLYNNEEIETLKVVPEERSGKNQTNPDPIGINRVITFGDQRIYEAMRPRTEIVGIEIDKSIEEALSIFIESGYSKLPVYLENLDNIKGVIYAYDVFKSPKNLQEIIKEIIFVPDIKKSFEMLNEFLNKRISIAVVIDEFGGTAGIITMEDIIEELFGEIKDEYDIEEEICRKIADDTFLISGKVEVDFINDKYDLNIPIGDYETLGGYITYRLGRIPLQGESIKIDSFDIQIARATHIKIEVVKLINNPDRIGTKQK